MAQAMPYEGLCLYRGRLKNPEQNSGWRDNGLGLIYAIDDEVDCYK